MARLLALEWNDNEARVAVASLRGTRAVLEQVFAIPLDTSKSDDKPSPNVGRQIAAGLSGGLKGTETLVAIGRANVELRQVSVPAAPDDELPDMVRFQAMREFNALDDTWPLDFISLSADPEQPRDVLAATINPDQLTEIRRVCRGAGLKPERMILRPCAAASLYSRQTPPGDGQVRLLVDLLQSEADLTLLIDGTVNLTRCARMHSDPLDQPEAPKALVSELRRTMAAAHNQLGDRRIDEVVLFGSGPQYDTLLKTLREELSLPVAAFDPFEGLELGGRLGKEMPDRPDRFAPLFGALLDELEQRSHAVDFLNPRRRPAPPSRRKSYVLAGVAVALVAFSLVGWRWNTRRVLMNEKAVLKLEMAKAPLLSAEVVKKYKVSVGTLLDEAHKLSQVRVSGRDRGGNRSAGKADEDKDEVSLTRLEEQSKRVELAVAGIDQWDFDKVDWLEELHKLSQTLSKDNDLGSEEILIAQLHARRIQGTGGGGITLKGWAKSSAGIKRMERELRNTGYNVKAGDKGVDSSHAKYPQVFDHTVSVTGGQK